MKTRNKIIAIRDRREIDDQLTRLAYKHRLSKSAYIRLILRHHLRRVNAL